MKITLLAVLVIATQMVHANDAPTSLFKLKKKQDTQEELAIERLIEDAKRVGKKRATNSKDAYRIKIIEEQAKHWGIDEGMYHFHQRYQARLESFAIQLDKITDFNQFVVNGNILLPTLQRTQQLFEQISDIELRTVNAAYSLEDRAKVVSSPPTWRDYLHFPMERPEKIPNVLMPRNAAEEAAFVLSFSDGWDIGKKQARLVLDESFSRLEQKLNGLYEFRFTNLMNIVSMPKAQRTYEGVVLDKTGRRLYVNDTNLKINHDAYFNEIQQWRPVFLDKVKK
jgi:defect-in-organelle-trafficking protein DotC